MNTQQILSVEVTKTFADRNSIVEHFEFNNDVECYEFLLKLQEERIKTACDDVGLKYTKKYSLGIYHNKSSSFWSAKFDKPSEKDIEAWKSKRKFEKDLGVISSAINYSLTIKISKSENNNPKKTSIRC